MSQPCVSLAGTTTCPAFEGASISTDKYLVSLFPFLANVTDTQSFDTHLQYFMAHGYVIQKYKDLFGCSNVNISNTTDLYARYSTSFICNAIIQNSITTCNLSSNDSRPLCANSCGDFALSEQQIVFSPSLCGTHNDNALSELRADFTNCALPANSISGTCVAGYQNEPTNCGFQSNLAGLCSYCGGSTQNSTDSCCLTSNVDQRCKNVHLPVYTSLQPLFTSTSSATPSTATHSAASTSSTVAAAVSGHHRLSGADIAGIVIATVVGVPLLILLLLLCYWRSPLGRNNRRSARSGTMEQRKGPWPGPQMPWAHGDSAADKSASLVEEKEKEASPSPPRQGRNSKIVPVPGSRITRMEALAAKDTPIYETTDVGSSPESNNNSTPAVGAAGSSKLGRPSTGDGAYERSKDPGTSPETRNEPSLDGGSWRRSRFRNGEETHNYSVGDSPFGKGGRVIHPPQREKSAKAFDGAAASSDPEIQMASAKKKKAGTATHDQSSPESDGRTSGEESHDDSERLSSFKDYYSGDNIHPGDLVSVLWAYQPRAADEFSLGRGQMLKVTGIWDDGWATGQKITRLADEHPTLDQYRDKGELAQEYDRNFEIETGEMKAFPLVCVCVPKYWKLTVQLDEQTDGTAQMERFFNDS